MEIDSSSPIPVYVQVEQLIEQLILRHQLSAHELVPGVAVLARQLRVAPVTVQRAYKRLQERGLIYSIAGKGSFVADASDQEFVGILVHNQYLLEAAQAPTMAILIQGMCEQLSALRMRVRILTDTLPRYRMTAPISPDVMGALEQGRPIGLLMMGHYGSDSLFDLTRKRSIPVIGFNSNSPLVDVRITFDDEAMLRDSLAFLRERSIPEAAVIWLDQDNSPAERLNYLKSIERIIIASGLKPNRDWIIGVRQGNDWAGYHAFNHLCSLPRRPQGLIVMDDVIGRGVHMGMLARQMRVPEDLLICVQTNEDSPIVFPEQWQQSGYNLGQCAREAVEILQDLIAGTGTMPADVKITPNWHGATARSPWNLPSGAGGGGRVGGVGQSGPMFQSSREVLETI